jgi:sugar phosphate isomerase/epimerase
VKLSVFTASTPDWTPEEAAQTLAAQGWDGVEWRVTDQADATPPGFWAGNRATWPFTGVDGVDGLAAEIARVTEAAGLAYSGIGGYQLLGDRDGVLAMLRLTARLGAHRVRVVMPPTGGDRPYPEAVDAARGELARVAEQASDLGVQALVEIHQDTIAPSASAALRLVDGLDPAHVGVIHDLGNLVVEGREHQLSSLQVLGPYLAHAHVKNAGWFDTGRTRDDGSAIWESRWLPMRAGQADVGSYLRDLRRVGYDGWITVEDFSTDAPLAERTADNLSYLRALLGAPDVSEVPAD